MAHGHAAYIYVPWTIAGGLKGARSEAAWTIAGGWLPEGGGQGEHGS